MSSVQTEEHQMMRLSIPALKSRRRKRLSVEVLEDRQLLATITVNTTADEAAADSTVSLREAIEVSDGTLPVSSLSTQEQAQVNGAVGSTNTIDFNIATTDPGYDAATGVWPIGLKSALPAISTSAAIIDGYSQPGAAQNALAQGDNASLKIALSGAGQVQRYRYRKRYRAGEPDRHRQDRPYAAGQPGLGDLARRRRHPDRRDGAGPE
jgi:CSLREA domain-containing protein